MNIVTGSRTGWRHTAVRLVALVALVAAAVGGTAEIAAAPLAPLIVGWEQFFTLSWEPSERRGRPVVWGKIKNEWGFGATSIRLLVDEFDASGRLIGQEIGWLGAQLPPGIAAPFEVPVRERAASYRVSVFAFSWVQSGNGADLR